MLNEFPVTPPVLAMKEVVLIILRIEVELKTFWLIPEIPPQ